MKQLAVLGVVALLAGCSGGASEKFTDAECGAFVDKFQQVTGVADNLYISKEEVANERAKYVAGCVNGELGVTRTELECGTQAAGAEAWKACNIIFNP